MRREDILALSKYRLDKAKEELDTARQLFELNRFSKSLNCSYYSIFHATRALLAYDQFDSKKHSGIISYFIKNYIASKILPQELARVILDAEDFRHDADYMDFYVVSSDDARIQIEKAKYFLESIESFIIKTKAI
ncbi:MAG TPA: HEPN domain-containing protein [Candidatus Wallbacteria bacterium]|nr:HEPN domain-containing protein [Candidatus Wallbacteria bacterium]